ncbi:unnamed protein product [Protopolystoma xenopodis]|uniref:Uncharacterized protein n=1 Tax=Protopolystoma xenopodis TaxID=117903 RepID=A0A3S5BE37_9PLAT|nr:unnamed protein product [Protopolystoma xenopodis]
MHLSSCPAGPFPYLPVPVISPHPCHRIHATQGVMFYTLPQAFDSTCTPASLSKPIKSGLSIDMTTQFDAAAFFIAVPHVHRVDLVVKPLLHGSRLGANLSSNTKLSMAITVSLALLSLMPNL